MDVMYIYIYSYDKESLYLVRENFVGGEKSSIRALLPEDEDDEDEEEVDGSDTLTTLCKRRSIFPRINSSNS